MDKMLGWFRSIRVTLDRYLRCQHEEASSISWETSARQLRYFKKIEDKSSSSSTISNDVEEIIEERQPRAVCRPHEKELVNMNEKATPSGRFLTLNRRPRQPLFTRSLINDAALVDDLQLPQVQCILDLASNWRFDAFVLENVSGGRCLPTLCLYLFEKYGLIAYYHLDTAKLWKLFSLVEEGYHSTNPYHNAVHAADVTQAMHCFLQQKEILPYMEPQELMAALLAAITHDMDHPGVNQTFLIATSNHLAELYKNTSVLENHHWRSAISCLIQSGVYEDLKGIWEALQQQISALILATDITRQQEFINQFKGYIDANTLDLKREEHRHLVLQIALKCADISNPCRVWMISRKWSLKVCEEFFRQGDYERKLNLPVSPLCDRHNTSVPKIQTGFLKFVVMPLITEWHRFLQSELSMQMINNLLYNQKKWESEINEEICQKVSNVVSVDKDKETDSETNVPEVPEDAALLVPESKIEEDDTDSEPNVSDISNLLVPAKRRSSLSPTQPKVFKKLLRRLSVPLFHDIKLGPEKKPLKLDANSVGNEEYSLYTVLSGKGRASTLALACKNFSTELLLSDSSIASLTSPAQATRLSTVVKGSGSKLGRGGPGTQLRDNLLDSLEGAQLLGRRKSIPTDNSAGSDVTAKNTLDLSSAIPQLISLSGKESWTHRRGSAPAPVAVSEIRGLDTLHSYVNGGRKKPGPASCNVQQKTFSNIPRRSSLPVEVLHRDEEAK